MKKIIIFLFTVSAIGLITMLSFNKTRRLPGRIIILNGPSGSGKSSIQKEFQKLMMPSLWIRVGIDSLFDGVMPEINPENMVFWQSPNPIRWIESSKDAAGNNIIMLFVGPEGEKVAYGMNSAIAAYAKNGCNVIVDYIAYKQEWLQDLEKQLKEFKTYYIAVDIPLETLEQREEARGTSPKGHARSHYFTVYGTKTYDLRVDSQKNSAQEIALQIKELIQL